MKTFDNYEISPARRYDDAGLPDPNGMYYEVCAPHEAEVWTLYGHIPGEGVQALGNFDTREHAEDVFFRITGVEFTGSYAACAHLHAIHAGSKLLQAFQEVIEQLDAIGIPDWHGAEGLDLQHARAAIAEATGNIAADARKPIVIEVRGGVVVDVLNVPCGTRYEIRDYDSQEDIAEDGRRP
jgi:hypothetical protein